MKTENIFKVILIVVLSFVFVQSYAQRPRAPKFKPHARYKKMPARGRAYKSTPAKAFSYSHSGVNYRYHSGVFYKPVGRKYVVARAPIGIRVRTLPGRRVHFMIDGRTYFYYYGTFYVKTIDDEYITVAPPIGAKVNALPEGYEKVWLDGNFYYEFDGTYYRAFVDEQSEVWYEVVSVR